jgi:hypothetical protein
MLSSNNNHRWPGHEQYSYTKYPVSDTVGDFYNRIYKGLNPVNQRRMSTKLLIWLFYGVGLPSYIGSCLAIFGWINISDAKSFILFLLGVLFMTARLIVYCVESYQKFKFRQKKLREK